MKHYADHLQVGKSTRWRSIMRPIEGAGILCILTLVFSLLHINSSAPAQVTAQVQPYDGVTLFRALYFGAGPVATKIPTLQKVTPYFPADYRNLESEVIKYIKDKNPTFFDSFAKDIQSGDRVRVGNAVKHAYSIQKEALLNVTKNSRTQFASDIRRYSAEPEPSPSPEPIKDIVIIVCLFIPIVVSAATVKPPYAEMKGLTFERYVDEIVRAVPRSRGLRETTPARPTIN